MSKAAEQFHKNIDRFSHKKGSVNGNYVDKSNIFGAGSPSKNPDSQPSALVSLLRDSIDLLQNLLKERVALMEGSLVEPLEMYLGHHESTTGAQFEQAKAILSDLELKKTQHEENKRLFLSLSYESAHAEIEIEKALLSQLQGEVSDDRVQEAMNKNINTKYKLQTAQKNYKDSVAHLN